MQPYPREYDYEPNVIEVNGNQEIVCEGNLVFITVYVYGIPDFDKNDYRPCRYEAILELDINRFI